jgi:hypothetical protein
VAFDFITQYEHAPASDFAPMPGSHQLRFQGAKLLAIISGRASTTVSIARRSADKARLLWKLTPWNDGYALAAGPTSVTFVPCGGNLTQYNGVAIVDGAQCVPVVVSNARGAVLGRGQLPFGKARCG